MRYIQGIKKNHREGVKMKPKTLDFKVGSEPLERPKEPKNSLVDEVTAVSRSLARTQIAWSLEQKKLFTCILAKIKWTESNNSAVVELNKGEVVEALGLALDSTDRSRRLRASFQKLARDSMVHWTDPQDADEWQDAFLITGIRSTRGTIRVSLNELFMPHLQDLVRRTPFLTFWSSDIYGFTSRFAILLYEDLRLHYDNRHLSNFRQYSTQELKQVFQLGKNDYMRSKSQGGFNRTGFERQVLDVAVAEINKTRVVSILPNGGADKNGKIKFYRKIKKDGLIVAYELRFICRTQLVNTEPEEK